MGVYGCSCSIVCTTNASVFWAILLALSTLYFETRSYWFDSFDSARLRGQWAPGIRQSPPPPCWGHRRLLQAPGFVTWVLGVRSLLFVFAPQFTNWTNPQLLIEDFFKHGRVSQTNPYLLLKSTKCAAFCYNNLWKATQKEHGEQGKEIPGPGNLGIHQSNSFGNGSATFYHYIHMRGPTEGRTCAQHKRHTHIYIVVKTFEKPKF